MSERDLDLARAERAVIDAAIRSRHALDAMIGGHPVTPEQANEYAAARLAEANLVDDLLRLREEAGE